MPLSPKSLITGLSLAILGVLASDAQAQTERYGVFSVQNDTGNVTLHFQVKIGNSPWQSYTLNPGEHRTFWHEYPNQFTHTSPPTKIRFNSAIDNNPPFENQYDLIRYAAPDRLYGYGKKYSFRKSDDNYFDLSATN